jgi:hypothetical protein
MKYENYIKLGFKRHNTDDVVLFRKTGYRGYFLIKDITETISISVNFESLNEPVMYIKKANSVLVHQIAITPEMVSDIFNEELSK